MRIIWLWIAILCCSNSIAQPLQIRTELFQEASTSAVGWKKNRGGRSWTEQDYDGFIIFIEQVANSTQGRNLLRKWGLPHDCFDAITFIHWLYAFDRGLALNYKNGLNSIRYQSNPIEFARQIIKQVSTRNSIDVSYSIDLNQPSALDSGLIYTHKGNPGHALYLVDLRKNGLFDRLEGPFPAQHSALLSSIFSERKVIEKASLRRMYMYTRTGSKITESVPAAYPETKNQALASWVGNDSLWQVLQRYYVDNRQVTLAPKIFINMFKELSCSKVRQRIQKVNIGVRACARADVLNKEECISTISGNYSTPSFDQHFLQISNFAQQIKPQLTPFMQCPAMNFTKGLDGSNPLWLQFNLTDDNGQLSNFFQQAINDQTLSDPAVLLNLRWGCPTQLTDCIGKTIDGFSPPIDTDINDSLALSQETDILLFTTNQLMSDDIKYLIIEDDIGAMRHVIEVAASNDYTLKLKESGALIKIYLTNALQEQRGNELLVLH